MKDIIKLAQELLRRRGLYSGVIDGIAGPETLKAVISAIGKKYELTSSPKRTEQYLVMFLQDYALSCG
ncbi:MAG: peptidoglycan-binding protein, partial [Chlorobium limicola]|uniref:peptidoglycan-binding domain-containing protein n=1 Tax=Chlorobium limicola TaxID=1092 RepID=UPI0023F58346